MPPMACFGCTDSTKRPFSSNSWRSRASLSAAYTPSTISPFGEASLQRNSTVPNCINVSHEPPVVKTVRVWEKLGAIAQDSTPRRTNRAAGTPEWRGSAADHPEDVGDVLLRLGVRRHAAEALHRR